MHTTDTDIKAENQPQITSEKTNKMSASIATPQIQQKPLTGAAQNTNQSITAPSAGNAFTVSPAKTAPAAGVTPTTTPVKQNGPNTNNTTKPATNTNNGTTNNNAAKPISTPNTNSNNNNKNNNVKSESKTPSNPNNKNQNPNNNVNKMVVNNMHKNNQNKNTINNNTSNKTQNAANGNNQQKLNNSAAPFNKNNGTSFNKSSNTKFHQNNMDKGAGGPAGSSKSDQPNSHFKQLNNKGFNADFGGKNMLDGQLLPTTSYAEKKFTGRCRLFVGNLPSDITEDEFKELFVKFGEVGECFMNTQRSFGFVKLDTRINAEHAKQELDSTTLKGRCIRVRFASHGAAVRVKNLSPYISNEYLEQAFSMFGPVERAVVIVDDKGRPTGDGIVEFERKPAASQCINKCSESCFILTGYPKPVVVEPLEQKDDEDGLPEKTILKNNQFYTERETGPHFAANGSYEQKLAMRWRELFELEKQIQADGKARIEHAREMLEYEVDQALIDQRTLKLKEDLRMKQEELQHMEDMRKTELQRRQEMEFRRIEEDRRRQEEMMMFKKQGGNLNGAVNGGNNMSILNSNGPQFDAPLLNQVCIYKHLITRAHLRIYVYIEQKKVYKLVVFLLCY
jgi:proline- and glutamine-rich splicing factor